MRSLVVFCAIFVVQTLQSFLARDGVTNCEIPNESEPGACRFPKDCPAFQEINDVSHISNTSRLSFVISLQCADGKVCCPRRSSYIHPWIDMTNITKKTRSGFISVKTRSMAPVEIPCGSVDYDGRVNNGEITSMYEFPWMAILIYEKTMNPVVPGCGGAVISKSFVVTAAHCLTGVILQKKGALKFVRVGEYDLFRNPDCTVVDKKYEECTEEVIDITPKRIIVHPDYRVGSVNQHHDIGLVELDQPLEFGEFTRHICLPEMGSEIIANKFTVCGWGRTNFFREDKQSNIQSPIKMKTSLPYVDHGKCSEIYSLQSIALSNGQICAGGRDARDTCYGDSGSPLMQYDGRKATWTLTGLVSMGPQHCGTVGKPGIYTLVREYVQWIKINAHL